MINFINPWWWGLLPLPWVIKKWWSPAVSEQKGGLKVPFFSRLYQIIPDKKTQASNSWFWCAYLCWTLLLIAVSGPEWLEKPIYLNRAGRDIMLAIDLSGSMQIPDMEINHQGANRLQVVKQVAEQFIANRKSDRLGLILFGSKAYLQTPLTFDLSTVRTMLLDATVGLAGSQTAIGDAIGIAIKHLKDYPKNKKVLVLLTDGVNNDGNVSPVEAASIAAKYGIKIYTVGLGANQVVVPTLLGPQILDADYELDEETLKEISRLTHGLYFHAANQQELKKVYDQLNHLEQREGDREVFRPRTPLYFWPLGIAFLLMLVGLFLHNHQVLRRG